MKILEPSGEFIFIQPAAGATNKNTKPPQVLEEYRNNLTGHQTSIKIVGGHVFDDASFATDLSITKIKNIKNPSNKIQKIIYKNNKTYFNVDLFDISASQIQPDIYASIRKKLQEYVSINNSLESVISKNGGEGIRISSIRGNMYEPEGLIFSNFYSFYSPPNYKEHWDNHEDGYVVLCKENEAENVYDYLEKDISRLGLAMYKYSIQTFGFMYVPLVDFSKIHTNEELYSLLKLNKQEREWAQAALSTYSARTKHRLYPFKMTPPIK